MDYVNGIIVGICIMSAFAIAAVMLADSGHDVLAIAFCGPAAWLWIVILKLCESIKSVIKHSRFKALLVCPDGEVRYINSKKAQVMVDCETREYKFVPFAALNVKATHWPKEYRTTLGNQTIGNVRYCPKYVWRQFDKISNEDYKYAKALSEL